MAANGVFVDMADAPVKTVSNPLTVEGEAKVAPKLAPAVGQHTHEILRELGYDDACIDALCAAGAV
jgi:crotonobetainyl-CoA:carnitine CoA-transferase CaiB-like acyl-CoA transferase